MCGQFVHLGRDADSAKKIRGASYLSPRPDIRAIAGICATFLDEKDPFQFSAPEGLDTLITDLPKASLHLKSLPRNVTATVARAVRLRYWGVPIRTGATRTPLSSRWPSSSWIPLLSRFSTRPRPCSPGSPPPGKTELRCTPRSRASSRPGFLQASTASA